MRTRSVAFRDSLNSTGIGSEVEVQSDNMIDSRDVENSLSNGRDDDVDVGDDIYGDLESAVFSSTSTKRKSTKSREELEDRLNSALVEISELKETVTTKSRENLNLRNNFSSLLQTAKEERNKNVRVLTGLRNELKQVVNANKRGTFLSKDEINRLNTYCNEVESSLQSEISYDVLRKALDDSKQKCLKDKRAQLKRPWWKHIKLDNISLYFSREQIPFSRLEPVTFKPTIASLPSQSKPP